MLGAGAGSTLLTLSFIVLSSAAQITPLRTSNTASRGTPIVSERLSIFGDLSAVLPIVSGGLPTASAGLPAISVTLPTISEGLPTMPGSFSTVSSTSECLPSNPQTLAPTVSGSASGTVSPLPGDISVAQPIPEAL